MAAAEAGSQTQSALAVDQTEAWIHLNCRLPVAAEVEDAQESFHVHSRHLTRFADGTPEPEGRAADLEVY